MQVPAPFDYARASALMNAQNIEAILVCSRANVGYLADYTYYTAQALPFLLEDGSQSQLTIGGRSFNSLEAAKTPGRIPVRPHLRPVPGEAADRRDHVGLVGVQEAGRTQLGRQGLVQLLGGLAG